MTKRTILTLVASVALLTTIVVSADQSTPAPRPAPRGLTTSRTWTDDDLDKIMKQVGPTAANLQKLIAAKEAPAAEAHADTLQYYFEDVEQFFDERKIPEAEQLARQAGEHADDVEDAVEDNDLAKAEEHLKLLMSTCETCHAKFRERAADGSYAMKKK
jgi:cytochrome c556